MKLSFIIPAYNEEDYLRDCLESIHGEIAGSPEAETEVIVVNNASTDNTEKVAKSFPGVKVVNEPQKGLVRARRAGFLAASGDLIANVDADTRLTPGWIKTVLAEFSKNPRLAALSGPFIYYDLSHRIQFWVKIFYFITYLTYLVNHFIFRIGSVLQGGNFVVRRGALEMIGGYDTNIYFYGEDTDLARRLSKAGKVKFTFKLPIRASGRRLAGEGALKTAVRYGLNYFWIIYLKRPFSHTAIDLRPSPLEARLAEDGSQDEAHQPFRRGGPQNAAQTPRPNGRTKQFATIAVALMVVIAFAFGVFYLGKYIVPGSFAVLTSKVMELAQRAAEWLSGAKSF